MRQPEPARRRLNSWKKIATLEIPAVPVSLGGLLRHAFGPMTA
jgi:hypothetical protein